MTNEQKKILKEILECQNCVSTDQFDSNENEILKNLEEKQYVQCVWIVTEKGKKVIKNDLS